MYTREFITDDEKKIIKYLDEIKYTGYEKTDDSGVTSYALDQKCTYDILLTNCICIQNFLMNKKNFFCVNDFINDQFSKKIYSTKTSNNGKAIIREETINEYDKIFGNTLNMLAYVGILRKYKTLNGNSFLYEVVKPDLIDLLAHSDLACVAFVCHFVYKILEFSPILEIMEKLQKQMNTNNVHILKEEVINWIRQNSSRQSDAPQISLKFINPLFYLYELNKFSPNSSKKYKWSKSLQQSLNDMSYFRIHKRDISKKPELTRQEYVYINSNASSELNEQKQKDKIKQWNRRYSEIIAVSDQYLVSELNESELKHGCHVHHIWPKDSFLKDNNIPYGLSPNCCENLIILDNNQHMCFAHKDNNTRLINYDNLNEILAKQYEKIIKFNKLKIGEYDIKIFLKLICYIKKVNYEDIFDHYSIELVKKIIDECISLKNFIIR